ncbi:MAG TPA: Stp1/IreP family PP2C-type Ser/Thr phosphatase [Ruminococcaceae bacterium]|nr:Stp1/IreP family PP2C-type Ser/Thr phosphatase [Oscillospiraceae bacterium]
MRISSKTDIGLVRLSNQDTYSTGELPGNAVYAAVCDGMGGAAGGNIASETAVRIISEQLTVCYREGMGSNSIKNMLCSAMEAANIGIYDLANSIDGLKGMGTTAVVVLLSGSTAHVVHSGDSRAYLVRNSELTQITKDHSVVQTMVDRGDISPDAAQAHPNKNVITSALGVDSHVDIDYNEVHVGRGESVLICTDGLTNYVSDEKIFETLTLFEFYEYPDRLIELAFAGGGGDNVTVVVIAE